MVRAISSIRVPLLFGLILLVACSSRWDDEDDDDDVDDARERTPSPAAVGRDAAPDDARTGELDAGEPEVDAAGPDALVEDAWADVDVPDATGACPTQTECAGGQLFYTLPPEHGCVVVTVDCAFGCDLSGVRCADADGGAPQDGGSRLGLPKPRPE
jgi:hypothetical protein